jgi:hypothetical protein
VPPPDAVVILSAPSDPATALRGVRRRILAFAVV